MKFLSYACIICLFACSGKPSHSFVLKGSIEGVKDSENIALDYFMQKNNELHEIFDTTKIINGKFVFEGNIDELTGAELCFESSSVAVSTRIYLEPTTMKLHINRTQPYTYELSGTKVEKENIELKKEMGSDEKIYYEVLDRMNDLFKQINSNLKENNTLGLDSLTNLLQQTRAQLLTTELRMNKTRLDFILRHNTYQIIPDLLYFLTKREFIPIDTIKHIYSQLPEQSKTSLMGKLALQQIKNSESKKNEDISVDSLIEKPAPGFTRKDFSGKTIRLSDFKNKNFVLLDFWASWCAPCIKEIPKIKQLHDKYSKKGLTIIGISSDTHKDRWFNAINKYELKTYPQILSAEDKNSSISNNDNISSMYHVDAIPQLILINKQGKVIARWHSFEEEQRNALDRIL